MFVTKRVHTMLGNDESDFFQVEKSGPDAQVIWIGVFSETSKQYREIPIFPEDVDKIILALQEVTYK